MIMKLNKIIHITPSYPPALGGMEKVVQTLARIQAKLGLKPSVITSKTNIVKAKDRDKFKVSRLKNFTIFNTKIMPSFILKLFKINRNDIVHLHISSAFMPELVWIFSKLKGFQYIAHIHLDILPTSKAGFLLKIYKPFILKHVLQSAGFVVVFTKDQLESVHKKYGVKKSKIKIVPNGVEDKYFFNISRKLHKKPKLLFVGRLGIQKNIPQLLKALKGVSEQFKTIIVGEGNLESKLKKLTKDLKLKNVSFVGRADGQKLLNYYKKSDIFVLPSEREGMPLVLLEAIAMGLPVVATDVTGNRDVIENNKNGLLVPLNDTKAFQSALLKLSRNEKLYSKLSMGAKKTAKQFSWENTSEKFEKLYKNLISKVKNLPTKNTTKGFKIEYLILPLLAVANILFLINNLFGSFITLAFFLFIPGFLILNLLNHEMKSYWKIVSFSLGLSLFTLMFGGLLLNTLNLFGLRQPLTTLNIFIMLDTITLILLAFNKNKTLNLQNIKFKFPSIKQIITSLLLTLLPFLAAGGAISLNNGGSNIFTMISFGLIPLVFIYLIWQKNLKPLYPYAIFTIGLSVLLSVSLRGWTITGHDIQHEFQVFQATIENNLWITRTQSKDPYNSCLSITILPTIFAKITTISTIYIYKFLFQLIFALGLIPIYLFIKKISNERKALIGSFLFISFPPFINDISFLNRQEIAFIFFGLLMLTTFIKMSQKSKTILTIIFLIGLMFSHYSTNYATLGILFLSWIFFKLLNWKLATKKTYNLPIVNLRILLLALLLTFIWNSQITKTTAGLERTVINTFNSIIHHKLEQSNGVTYALFSFKPEDPNKILVEYAGDKADQVQYSPEENLSITKLGESISRIVNIETLNKFIRASSAKLLQVLLLISLIILLIRLRKKATQKNIYLYALTVSFFVSLVLITLLPNLSVDYSVTRLFQQSLIVISLPIIIATEFLLGFFGRYKGYIVAGLYAFLFLHLSGFLPQILGGYPPQLALNNSGTYYDIYYVHKSELAATKWLNQIDTHMNIAMDRYARMRFPGYPFLKQYPVDPVLSKNESEYLYQDYANIHNQIYANYLRGNVIKYSYSSPTANGNLLYSNKDNRIYKK